MLFIVFEGPDGSGKTSCVKLLDHELSKTLQVVCTREPGGTRMGEALRNMIKTQPLQPETELLLMVASRVEHVRNVIGPALAEGAVVLCDRFVDSTYVYQGAKGVSEEQIQAVASLVVLPQPDIVVFFPHLYRDSKVDELENVDQAKILEGYRRRFDSRWIEVPRGTTKEIVSFVYAELRARKVLSC